MALKLWSCFRMFEFRERFGLLTLAPVSPFVLGLRTICSFGKRRGRDTSEVKSHVRA